ncbi:hypothetical protein PVK06_023532 [Gossypium arboreum]|uniref:Uncharacterized protein n=1 Tax=Gossypium arboreum TaxID=29729 RepID=A0ABR0PBE1_GOSAR|nr:hypothetical protein PVK06_023532 [Gossypium arboreum]
MFTRLGKELEEKNRKLERDVTTYEKKGKKIKKELDGLKIEKSVLGEKVKKIEASRKTKIERVEKRHNVEMENFKKNQQVTLEKYEVEMVKNLQDYLPKLKSNIILHAQVVADPFDVLHVNFNSLSSAIDVDLGFDIFSLSG